ERGLLMQNAPHLVHNLAFVVPSYEWWNGPFYGVGLKVYDLLAGKLGLGPSRLLSREETLKRIPTLEPEGLRGGVIYYDGQFEDARLAINLAQTAEDYGATVLNYMRVVELKKTADVISGVTAIDLESGQSIEFNGRVVINATGVFSDRIREMDEPGCQPIITPSQGVHLVLPKEFLKSDAAIMVPHTADGRVLFAVPWHERVVVGTTDTPVEKPVLEPCALQEEIDFILTHAARYLTHDPDYGDILSVFAGLRPLVNLQGGEDTAEISRDHHVMVSKAGLVTIAGGKWTTYRKMAEDTIQQAALVAGLPERPSITRNLRIHGWLKAVDRDNHLHIYGSDRIYIEDMIKKHPELGKKLHPELPYIKGEVVWAVRQEMARSVEDVLARRTRALLLNAELSMKIAPEVAEMMARELKVRRKKRWIKEQLKLYMDVAKRYLPQRTD
ncbi:MAG: glycerol-3-phosphate dehydrogenase/oxidase, partial [Calditrichaeota bacterium]